MRVGRNARARQEQLKTLTRGPGIAYPSMVSGRPDFDTPPIMDVRDLQQLGYLRRDESMSAMLVGQGSPAATGTYDAFLARLR